jgi:hypothetical protein
LTPRSPPPCTNRPASSSDARRWCSSRCPSAASVSGGGQERGWDQVGTFPPEQAFLIVYKTLDVENAEEPPELEGVHIVRPIAEEADDEPEAEEPER